MENGTQDSCVYKTNTQQYQDWYHKPIAMTIDYKSRSNWKKNGLSQYMKKKIIKFPHILSVTLQLLKT